MMNFAIIDVETTGGSLRDTKITEIALLIHDGEKIIDEYQTLVNPECDIPPFITRLTGINQKMVQNAPKFYEIAKTIVELTVNCIFVAHNVAFDYKVIRQEFSRLGYDYRREHLCTVRTARYALPGHVSYSLGKLSDDLGIEINGRHRAGGDALATSELFALMYEKLNGDLSSFIQKELNPKLLHPGLDLAQIESLPSKPGVYYFYDVDEQLIYIGKSKNIKSRVVQHLKNNRSKKAVLLRESIAKVDVMETGSELIALLLESEQIKKHRPKFNRRLVKNKCVYGLYSFEDGKGYLNLYIDRTMKKNSLPLLSFERRDEAVRYLEKQVEKYRLCKKLTGLYPSKYGCFDQQIGVCKGACIGDENPELYNARIQRFLEKIQFENDCFFLIDIGRKKGEISLVLVEYGVYKGFGYVSAKSAENLVEDWLSNIEYKPEDRDAKQIIQAAIRKANYKQIRSFSLDF